jgi:hypothetical protein
MQWRLAAPMSLRDKQRLPPLRAASGPPIRSRILARSTVSGDTATLAKSGRFLEPFAQQIPGRSTASPATSAFFQARYDEARRQFDSACCVR